MKQKSAGDWNVRHLYEGNVIADSFGWGIHATILLADSVLNRQGWSAYKEPINILSLWWGNQTLEGFTYSDTPEAIEFKYKYNDFMKEVVDCNNRMGKSCSKRKRRYTTSWSTNPPDSKSCFFRCTLLL